MKTTMTKGSDLQREWLLIDGENEVLGRLATQISLILQGKAKPTYTPHMDDGDFVVVVNADKIRLTGNKTLQKKYFYYTGYIRGLREITYEDMRSRKPTEILRLAVKRMLPKNRLGRKMLKKLKIYIGPEHPHGAQQPRKVDPVKKHKKEL